MTPSDANGILSLLYLRGVHHQDRTALSELEDGRWIEVSYAELARRSRELSDALIERGFPAGGRAAILSESRPEWVIAFFAAVRAGAVVVPLDPKLGHDERRAILADAEASLLFVSRRLASEANRLKPELPALKDVVVLDGPFEGFPGISELRSAQPQEGRERRLEQDALIVYTSGTTGRPKGVVISFANLVFEVRSLLEQVPLAPEDVFVSLLPLHHLLELTGGLLSVLYAGGEVCYPRSLLPQELLEAVRARRATRMITVPLFLKLIMGEIRRGLTREGRLAEARFALALALGRAVPVAAFRRRLFARLHAQLGGRLHAFVSGGARLPGEVETFFESVGLPVYQGYGMTESGPVISVNAPGARRFGSVGRPLGGVEVRIAGDGEILTRGPHVMRGYLGAPEATREILDAEGWLRTGDLGYLDRDGFLYVTGRKKNLIVLGDGKKVQPEEVEAVLTRGTLFREVCVVGSIATEGLLAGSEQVCAVVVPSDALRLKAGENLESVNALARHEADRLCAGLASWKRPTRVVVRDHELPKTASQKIRRQDVRDSLSARET